MSPIDQDSTLYGYRPLPRGWAILGLAVASWALVALIVLGLWTLIA